MPSSRNAANATRLPSTLKWDTTTTRQALFTRRSACALMGASTSPLTSAGSRMRCGSWASYMHITYISLHHGARARPGQREREAYESCVRFFEGQARRYPPSKGQDANLD